MQILRARLSEAAVTLAALAHEHRPAPAEPPKASSARGSRVLAKPLLLATGVAGILGLAYLAELQLGLPLVALLSVNKHLLHSV